MNKLPASMFALLASLFAGGLAIAGDFVLGGNERWVVLASRPDLDEAIGVARYHRWQHSNIRVMRSANGWFAVVFGPEQVANPRLVRDRLTKTGDIPKDFIFSRGDSYVEQVWSPSPARTFETVKYDGKRDSLMRLGDLAIAISSAPEKDGSGRHPIANGRLGARQSFRMSLGQSVRDPGEQYGSDFAEMRAIRLDPSSTRPSLVFSSFWGGAHCCTVTQIATEESATGRWTVADGDALDGDGGYGFEDIDGDGFQELLSGDQSFLYAFGGYASANPPTKIHRARGGRVEEVTRYPAFAGYLRQELAMMEYGASLNAERWRDNNFLAGWVAQNILVGRGEQAWVRMLQLYDRNDDWPLEECAVSLPLSKCPDGKRRKTDFPTALRRHLDEHGYGTGADGLRQTPDADVTSGPPQYDVAASQFDRLLLDERINLQVLVIATGHQNSVPTERFSKRTFDALLKFQKDNGLTVSGAFDKATTERLTADGRSLLDTWDFRQVGHPTMGNAIWVPQGLALRSYPNKNGVSFQDPQKRLFVGYNYFPGTTVQESYNALRQKMANEGTTVHYAATKDDWYVISATSRNGNDQYIRYHRYGSGILGFALFWNNENGNIFGERIAILMSSSLGSVMNGRPFIDVPGNGGSVANVAKAEIPNNSTYSPPVAPTVPAPVPTPVPPVTPKAEERGISSGSGFFVDAKANFVTSAHVVKDCKVVIVKLNDGKDFHKARIAANDTTNDLALLSVDDAAGHKFAPVRIGVRLGEGVAAFGYPHADVLASAGNFTLGNITALAGIGDDSRYYQMQTPVQSGNSGGPLLDNYGNVVGVVSNKLNVLKMASATGDMPQNVNFALKGSTLIQFLEANSVGVTIGSISQMKNDPADVAEDAKAVSGFVACQ